jgi:hypothetical protein
MAEALLYEFEEVHMQIQNPEALSEDNVRKQASLQGTSKMDLMLS